MRARSSSVAGSAPAVRRGPCVRRARRRTDSAAAECSVQQLGRRTAPARARSTLRSSRTLPGQACACEHAPARASESAGARAASQGASDATNAAREQRQLARALAQRRDRQRDAVEAEVEIAPEARRARPRPRDRGWSPRRSARRSCARATPPTRSTSRVSSTRRSLACSRQRQLADLVEEDGAARRRLEEPGLACAAPVNAPRSWPKSSLSSSDSESAAQLTETNGAPRAASSAWIARASTSLPTPVSPRMSTLMSPAGGALREGVHAPHALLDAGHRRGRVAPRRPRRARRHARAAPRAFQQRPAWRPRRGRATPPRPASTVARERGARRLERRRTDERRQQQPELTGAEQAEDVDGAQARRAGLAAARRARP